MGTTLTGTTPQDTYDSLIKVTDNGPISGTLKALSDGLGNDSTLSLSTTAASIAGTLAVSGDFSIADKIVHIGDTNTAIRFPDADTITFETSGVERVRINSAGNVGIGVTPSAWSGGISSALQGRNGSGIAFGFSGLPVVYHTSNAFYDGTNWIYNATATATLTTQNNNDGSFSWLSAPSGTAGTAITFLDRMSINAAGVLNLNQGQIKFPATQVPSADANTLDDYEEGTWTPTDASGAGLTLTTAVGSYTKIGREVFYRAFIQYPSTADASNATLGGLPYTVANINSARSGNVTYTDEATLVYAFSTNNTTSVGLYTNIGGFVTNATMSGNLVFIVGNYYV